MGIKDGCGNPKCGASSGFCEEVTFGSGKLDTYGYWERPCALCARAFEKANPEFGSCWPFAHISWKDLPLFWLETTNPLTLSERIKALNELKATRGMVGVVMARPSNMHPTPEELDRLSHAGHPVEFINWDGMPEAI
jgi:hypothetical protein